jgi:hypothetical protein
MNILTPKLGAVLMGPNNKTSILSKTGITILITFH